MVDVYPPRRTRQRTLQLEEGTHPGTASTSHLNNEPHAHDGEDDDHSGSDPPMLKVTGFRLLNTCIILSFGISKAILSYRGQSIMPTTLELATGTFLTICLYWLDKLEAQPRMAWLFHMDYLDPVVKSLGAMYVRAFSKEISVKLKDLARKNFDDLTNEDILMLRDTYRRFRVLVLGPTKAGKTTLLERLSDRPTTVTRDGERVIQQVPGLSRDLDSISLSLSWISWVFKGSGQRGSHRITDEITYASNPGFVFHCSSFEAGTDEEIRIVRKFIQKRSSASPSERLHAIWICIPTDNDQPLGSLNPGIFSESTGSVPVIGIFTKLDGRERMERDKLLGPGPSRFDIAQSRSEVEQKTDDFVRKIETEMRKLPQPPTDFVRLRSMYNDHATSRNSGRQLLQTTVDAFPPGTLKLFLRLTVQNKTRRTRILFVLKYLLDNDKAAEGNIVDRSSAPGKDEASELRENKAFRMLSRSFLDLDLSDRDLDLLLSLDLRDSRDLRLRLLRLDLRPLDSRLRVHWSDMCAPLLKLSRQPPMPSNPEVRHLTLICLTVLRIWCGWNADLPDGPEVEHTARSIQERIANELVDKGNGRMELDSFSMAEGLTGIIHDVLK